MSTVTGFGESAESVAIEPNSAPLETSVRQKIADKVSTAYEGAKTMLKNTDASKAYRAQKEANSRLDGSSSSDESLEQKRARVGGNCPYGAFATTFFVKTPAQFFHEKVLKKNPLSNTTFGDLKWRPTSFFPSLFKATMKFVSSPLTSLGCDKFEKLQDWLNNKVQAGDTYKITKLAAATGHGVFSALKIGRVALAVVVAIGVTLATIGVVAGIAATAFGLALGTSPFWLGAAVVNYKLGKKIDALEERLKDAGCVNSAVISVAEAAMSDDAASEAAARVRAEGDGADAAGA
jgi:hypothetical protein